MCYFGMGSINMKETDSDVSGKIINFILDEDLSVGDLIGTVVKTMSKYLTGFDYERIFWIDGDKFVVTIKKERK